VFAGTFLNKILFLWRPVIENNSKGSTRLDASLPENGNRTSVQNVVLL